MPRQRVLPVMRHMQCDKCIRQLLPFYATDAVHVGPQLASRAFKGSCYILYTMLRQTSLARKLLFPLLCTHCCCLRTFHKPFTMSQVSGSMLRQASLACKLLPLLPYIHC